MLAAVLSKDGSDWLQCSLNHVITVGPIVSQVPFSASRNICTDNPLHCHIDMLSIHKKEKISVTQLQLIFLKSKAFPQNEL